MIEAPKPSNENERISYLREMRILDTPLEERFERITRIVCRSLDVPISAISLVDEERQWFKSIQGLDVSETSRSTDTDTVLNFQRNTSIEANIWIVQDQWIIKKSLILQGIFNNERL